MADKKQLSLNPCTTNSRAGASGLPMNGGEVFSPKSLGFSLQPCCTQVKEEESFTGEGSAPKRKAPTAGPKGCSIKRKGGCGLSKGEDAADEEAAAEKAEVTVVVDEAVKQEDDSNLDKFYEEWRAEYAQLMDELFGNGPNATPVKWVKHPSCMYYEGQDDDEVEEVCAVYDGIPPAVSN